jgi:hypothetical protein
MMERVRRRRARPDDNRLLIDWPADRPRPPSAPTTVVAHTGLGVEEKRSGPGSRWLASDKWTHSFRAGVLAELVVLFVVYVLVRRRRRQTEPIWLSASRGRFCSPSSSFNSSISQSGIASDLGHYAAPAWPAPGLANCFSRPAAAAHTGSSWAAGAGATLRLGALAARGAPGRRRSRAGRAS